MAEGPRLRILWVNEASFLQALRQARAQVADLTPAMRLIAKDFFESEKSVFERQGPGPYKDLKKQYKKKKQLRWGFVYPVNKASGALMRSVTNPNDENAICEVNATSFIAGTRLPYGAFVQSARPYLFGSGSRFGTNQTQGRMGRWSLILKSYVVKVLRGPRAA